MFVEKYFAFVFMGLAFYATGNLFIPELDLVFLNAATAACAANFDIGSAESELWKKLITLPLSLLLPLPLQLPLPTTVASTTAITHYRCHNHCQF